MSNLLAIKKINSVFDDTDTDSFFNSLYQGMFDIGKYDEILDNLSILTENLTLDKNEVSLINIPSILEAYRVFNLAYVFDLDPDDSFEIKVSRRRKKQYKMEKYYELDFLFLRIFDLISLDSYVNYPTTSQNHADLNR
ncbi:hypothetical protein [Flavobacterium sp.]|uniref:hypothetical protein n=1 Tax=Flavobacterium sp. TaxID=239 RepID=UPI00260BA795|nr:hypothetical protein [Flavobacterium sp.]